MKNIDIVDVKSRVKNGQLRSFVENGKIFLEDTVSGECVEIGTVSPVCTACSAEIRKNETEVQK